MKFSVVIPAFNAQQTIQRAIDSCLNQTLLPYEIIIINDASNDDTLQVLNTYNLPCIKVISNKENKGVSYSRNVGWDLASGDYVAFLDSDDEWHQEKLKICNEVINEEAKVIFHSFGPEDFTAIDVSKIQLKKLPFVTTLLTNIITPSGFVINNQIPLRFDETIRYCEDHELFIRIALKYDILQLPIFLTKKYKSPNSLSSNLWEMRRGELKMYSNLYKVNWLFIFIIPFLWVFSLVKYISMKAR